MSKTGRTVEWSCACLAALAVGACSNAPQLASFRQVADQNVLLITVDTLRADALGCDGGPARTPNIDALAAEGVHFTFAHAHTVVTLPSHASILTGTYPFQHGVRDNSGYRLASGTDTLATRLKAAGFATGAFVAAFPLDARFGLAAGFDVYDGRFDDSGSGAAFLLPERPATVVVARASAWIRTQDRRWFAWVHVYEPHAPYRPPSPFDAEYAAQPYFGEVAAVDRALGPLLEVARTAARPTLVVFTGDHGEALGDHGETTHGLFAYESTLHVPLIMASTGSGAKGAKGAMGATGAGANGANGATGARAIGARGASDVLARHVDILPTILDILGLAIPADLPGHSLRTGADRRGGIDRPSYFEAMSGMLDYGAAPLDGLVAGREKYINLPIPELYDLAHDGAERDNLIDRAGERRRALEAQLAAFAAARPGTPRTEDAATAARLRSLGYIGSSAPPKAHVTDADDPKRLVDLDRQLHDAVTLGEQGRLREAVERYRQVLAARPQLTAATRHLAFAYWRLGDARAAIDTLQGALVSSGGDAGLRVQLGTYLFEIGRATEALALLEEAARPGTNLDALNALGLAYARAGRTDEALAAFNRSLRLDADNAATHENIGAVALDAGRLEAAREEFAHAIRSNPQSAKAHAGLALASIKAGDRPAAIAEWKAAVAIDSASFDALYNLGVQLARGGQTVEARRYLEQFARTAPPAQYGQELRNVSALLAQTK